MGLLKQICEETLQPRQPLTFTVPRNPYLLVTTRSSRAPPFLDYSNSCRKKLLPAHSRNLLDCLCQAALSLQNISGWLKSLVRTRNSECEAAPVCRWPHPLFPLGQVIQADIHYNITFSCSLVNPNQWTLIQTPAELHVVQLLSHIKDMRFPRLRHFYCSTMSWCSVMVEEQMSMLGDHWTPFYSYFIVIFLCVCVIPSDLVVAFKRYSTLSLSTCLLPFSVAFLHTSVL